MADKNGEKKVRDVVYAKGFGDGLDELPKTTTVRETPIRSRLDEIKGDTNLHGKWHPVASYGNGAGASSSLQNVRKNYGYTPHWQGWEFATARTEENGNPRTVLFAKHVPSMITNNGEQVHKAEIERRAGSGRGRPKKDAKSKQGNK